VERSLRLLAKLSQRGDRLLRFGEHNGMGKTFTRRATEQTREPLTPGRMLLEILDLRRINESRISRGLLVRPNEVAPLDTIIFRHRFPTTKHPQRSQGKAAEPEAHFTTYRSGTSLAWQIPARLVAKMQSLEIPRDFILELIQPRRVEPRACNVTHENGFKRLRSWRKLPSGVSQRHQPTFARRFRTQCPRYLRAILFSWTLFASCHTIIAPGIACRTAKRNDPLRPKLEGCAERGPSRNKKSNSPPCQGTACFSTLRCPAGVTS
jgi:hypothetical protein